MNKIRFDQLPLRQDLPNHGQTVQKKSNKCILCRKCLHVCQDIQTVNLKTKNNANIESIATADIDISSCALCGQCSVECPTSALSQVNLTQDLLDVLDDPKKTVVGMISPAAISGFLEFFSSRDADHEIAGKIIAGMKKLGFSHVFDQSFATDVLALEEAFLFLHHIENTQRSKLLISSICPSSVRFLKHHYPELIPNLASTKTSELMFSQIIKMTLAEELKKDPDDISVVWVSSCLTKKTIAKNFKHIGISVHELAALFKEAHLDLNELDESSFSAPFNQAGKSSTFSVFSGGILDSVLKTAYELHTGNDLLEVDFIEMRGLSTVEISQVEFPNGAINVARAYGLNNVRALLEKIKRKEIDIGALEILACPLGCIGGPGLLPISGNERVLERRQKVIYNLNLQKTIKMPHKNPALKHMYKKLFTRPGSQRALEVLHNKTLSNS